MLIAVSFFTPTSWGKGQLSCTLEFQLEFILCFTSNSPALWPTTESWLKHQQV